MSSSFDARRGATAALTAIAAAVLFFVCLAPASSSAADVTTGQVTFNITSGKAGKVTAIKPAKVTKRNGKGAKVTSPAKNGNVRSNGKADLKAGGGLRFASGKRKVTINGLSVSVSGNQTVVRGKLGGKTIKVFQAKGKANVNSSSGTAKLNGAKLTFSSQAASKIRKSLKLKKAPKGKVGALSINLKITSDTPVDPCVANPNAEGCQPVDPCVANPDAQGCPIVDPYLAQCNVAATSKVTGSLPAPAALPTLSSPKAISGLTSVSWGIKSSLRSYIVSPATKGSIHASDGATATGSAPAYSGFDWSFVDGKYTDNGTPNDALDDQAILNLNGTVVLCATGHNFRVAISDPTIVIDGLDSRIIADVDANLAGVWVPTQRIDLTTLDLSGVTPTTLPTTNGATWSNVPATLTQSGGKAICGDGEPLCPYTAGTAMDPITVSAPSTQDQYSAECPVAIGGRQNNAWANASALPTMSDTLATTGPTSIDWGYKQSFRNYVQYSPPAGSFVGLGGANVTPGNPGPVSGFSFPVTSGQYAANDPADNTDDQAVIDGSGTGIFCKSGHFFWSSISEPTIVIDGENSRIVATISENLNGGADPAGSWNTPQRVDLAELDLTGVTPVYNKSGSEVTWSNIPVKQLVDFSNYESGTAMDPISVTVKTPYDTGAGDAAAWDALATHVQTNHPFPNSNAATGGCEVGVPAGGTATAARTIDEHLSYGGTSSTWMPSPGVPAATPAVTGTTVTGGGLDWGFRASLRSSVSGSGQFNLTDGALASTDYYGNGGTLGTFGGYGMNMGAPASYFTWPTANGTYKENGVGDADDQLLLRTEGVVGFCQLQAAQRYGIIFSNPTVVIDGANSRLTYDVATRYRLSWIRATVDFAKLDVSQATLTPSTVSGTVTKTWSFPGAAVTLTADGEKMARILQPPTYVEGLALDGLTIRASFPE